MTATMSEAPVSGSTNSTSAAATITVAPVAGDVLVAWVETSGGVSPSSVSGCGATWTKLVEDLGSSGTSYKSVSVWTGVGATTTGAVTATFAASALSAVRVFHSTGTSSTTVTATTTRRPSGSDTTLAGPASTAGPGQVVIDTLATYPSGTPTWTHTPSTGWTDQTLIGYQTWLKTFSGWIAPSSSGTFGTDYATLTNGSADSVATHIVIGGGSGPTPATTLDLAASLTLGFDASPVVATTLGTPLNLALGFDATSEAPTTLDLGVTTTLGFEAISSAPTSLDLGVNLAMGFDATTTTPATLTLAGTLPLPVAAFTLTQPYQTAPNNAGGRGRTGIGYVTYDPPVIDPPATVAPTLPVTVDKAIAHGPVTITGTQAVYTTSEAMKPALRTRVTVGGVDISFFRGIATPEPDYSLISPFLYGSGTLYLPQVLPAFEKLGAGVLAWLKPGAKVKIQGVDTTTHKVVATYYLGYVVSFNTEGPGLTCDLGGQLAGKAALTYRWPRVIAKTNDIGHQAFYFCRRHGVRMDPPLPEIGIKVAAVGGMSELDYGNQLMSMAATKTGGQYTVMPDSTGVYRIALKDTTTIAATAYFDDARLPASLKRDIAEEPNAVFATSVQTDGRRVRFAAYPGLVQGTIPPYPFASGASFGVGTTDADTDDPAGQLITAMLNRLSNMGYIETSEVFDGYDTTVAEGIEDLQRDAGLTVTGTMTKKTWRALYDLDATGYSLGGVKILPAAMAATVRVWDLTASGAQIRRNPKYDPSVLRVDRAIDIGTGFNRRQDKVFARAQMSTGDNWVGTVTCNLSLIAGTHTPGDPITAADVMSPLLIKPGMNVWAPHFDGGTLFHVSGVQVSGGLATLTLDTRARDTMAAWQVILRNRESRKNPARAWIQQHRSSTMTSDAATEWDPIGGVITDDVHIPNNGWAVFPVVAGQEGIIERIRLQTTPAAEFVCAVFGRQVSPKLMHEIAPDPLSKAGSKHWQSQHVRNRLDKHILLYIAGANDQPCGYWPGQKTDENGSTGDHLTGTWFDDAGFGYRTFAAPVLWVAVWADRKCRLDANDAATSWGWTGPYQWGQPKQTGQRIMWDQLATP